MAPRPRNKIVLVLIYEGVQYTIITLGFAVATVVVALISTGLLPWRKQNGPSLILADAKAGTSPGEG